MLIPGHKKINSLLLEMEQGPAPVGGPPPQVARSRRSASVRRASAMALDLLLVVILCLMIWKPGL